MTTIAVIAMGDMGAGIGARLVRGGAIDGCRRASTRAARDDPADVDVEGLGRHRAGHDYHQDARERFHLGPPERTR